MDNKFDETVSDFNSHYQSVVAKTVNIKQHLLNRRKQKFRLSQEQPKDHSIDVLDYKNHRNIPADNKFVS